MTIKMTDEETAEFVVLCRCHLRERGLPCGSKAILEKLKNRLPEYKLPSPSTIAHILKINNLTGKTRHYEADF